MELGIVYLVDEPQNGEGFVRGSSLPLLLNCYGSAILPNEIYESQEAERARKWGKDTHSWVETGKTDNPALLKAIKLSGIDRQALWPLDGRHEISVALRVDGIREVQVSDSALTNLLDDRWITGTADYQGYLLEELWLDDTKTGKEYLDDEGNNRFPQDVCSPQLSFYAIALARAADYHGPVHVSLTHWPRLPLSARHSLPKRYWVTYSEEEQETLYSRLERMYNGYTQDKASGQVHTTPGDHCRFCPSRNYCLDAKTDFPLYQVRKR